MKSTHLRKKRRVAGVSPEPLPVDVQTVVLAFQTWVPFCLRTLVEKLGDTDSLETYAKYSQQLIRTTISSAFSGVGAPETSYLNLVQYFCFMISSLSIDEFPLAPLWALELDEACRDELMRNLCRAYLPPPPKQAKRTLNQVLFKS